MGPWAHLLEGLIFHCFVLFRCFSTLINTNVCVDLLLFYFVFNFFAHLREVNAHHRLRRESDQQLVCICMFVHVYIYIYIYTHVCMCIYIYIYTCVYIYIYTYMYIYIYTHMCNYVYIDIHIITCVYIYIYRERERDTYAPSRSGCP